MRTARNTVNTLARLNDGTTLHILPLIPQDKNCLQAGYMCLSKRSRYYRFLTFQKKLNDKQLKYLTEIDYIKHFAPGARLASQYGKGIGIGRFVRIAEEPDTAEVGLITIDAYQQKGLSTLFLQLLAQYARQNKLRIFRGYVLEDNHKLLNFVRHFHANISWEGGPVLKVDIKLSDIETAPYQLRPVYLPDLKKRVVSVPKIQSSGTIQPYNG